ncbi:hypothetical protein GEMRC1_008372 [Eukaryota sp. GEM-RC1]
MIDNHLSDISLAESKIPQILAAGAKICSLLSLIDSDNAPDIDEAVKDYNNCVHEVHATLSRVIHHVPVSNAPQISLTPYHVLEKITKDDQ